MSGTITRLQHRHGDQKPSDTDLVLEVDQLVPAYYQRPGRRVLRIDGHDPLHCWLDDGDCISVGRRKAVVMV